ncbi:MAG: sensor histidine kinase [Alistipes sp.]|nr:sensor histidine kinase [Alistipes sp.]
MPVIKILLIIAILVQTVATVYALNLVRATKYNSVWILFIIGFSLLSVERFIQLLMIGGHPLPRHFMADIGFIISICLSIGVMYAHKLFKYIDRLNYQRQLMNRRILTAVLRTEEKARSTFSKELHDGLGPLLSSAKMSLSALAREEQDPARRELLGNTSTVIEEAIRSLREISNNLSPHVLNDFGLARGIRNFLDKSIAMHGLDIRFTTNLNDERFEKDVEVIFYRVICELVNNSLKHAHCSRIDLALSHADSILTLDYRDNGCGFRPEMVSDTGMGLSNISSRINSLGGSFDLDTAPGRGMKATIRIDLGGEQPAKRPTTRKRKKYAKK